MDASTNLPQDQSRTFLVDFSPMICPRGTLSTVILPWFGGICPMIFPVAAAVWLTMATFTLAAELRVLRVPHAQHLPGPSQRLVGGGRENPLGEWDLTWTIGSFHGIQWYSQIGDNIFPNFPIFHGWNRAPGIFFRARAKTWCWWNWETSQIRSIYIYIVIWTW